MPILIAILTFVVWLIAGSTGYGADVVVVTDHNFQNEPGCTVRITNEIVPGDLEKLKLAFGQVGQGSDVVFGSLCLNSPGGSYAEGLKIADWMLSQYIFTVVEPNGICFSACAIIFMTGGDFEEGRAIERYLHPTSRLGFHAPYLVAGNFPDRAYSNEALPQVYQAAIAAVRDLAKLGQQHRVSERFLSKALLAELLDKGPDEAFLVDTTFKLVRLDIRLYGYRQPAPTLGSLGNACLNVHYNSGIDVSLDDPPQPWAGDIASIRRKGKQFWFGGFGNEGSEYCVVAPPSSADGRFSVSRSLVLFDHVMRPEEFHTAHPWFLFPPATPLNEMM